MRTAQTVPALPSFTVFELSESDQPIERRLVLHQAFALVCEKARFKPCWTREGFITTLELREEKGAREISPRSITDPDPEKARRDVMKQVLAEGVWGFFAVPDRDYDREMHQAEEFACTARRQMERAMREKVVPIDAARATGFPLARFDGDAVWSGKPEDKA